jgi:hypothetical protein
MPDFVRAPQPPVQQREMEAVYAIEIGRARRDPGGGIDRLALCRHSTIVRTNKQIRECAEGLACRGHCGPMLRIAQPAIHLAQDRGDRLEFSARFFGQVLRVRSSAILRISCTAW